MTPNVNHNPALTMAIKSDGITLKRIAKLHPAVRAEVQAIATELWDKGVNMRVTYGLRTWEEQNALYQIGRTTPGNIVTNAKAGQSYHNYGLAVDFCILTPTEKASWSRFEDFNADAMPDFMQVVDAFKAKGWEWGGDWAKFKDYPHVQKTFGYRASQLMEKSSNGLITYPKLT
jgi:peptidoglycan L-alanyl-D-glutamate endopeptidase CwlK